MFSGLSTGRWLPYELLLGALIIIGKRTFRPDNMTKTPTLFTMQSSYASAVMGILILSIRHMRAL